MEPTPTLLTLAEVSIATVGFAGVVSVLRGSPAPEDAAMRQWRLRFMVTSGTGAVVFCLIPLPLLAHDVPEGAVWTLCSLLLGVLNLGFAAWTLREQRLRLGAAFYRGSIVNDGVMLAVIAAATLLAAWNVASDARFSIYLLGVIVWLGLAVNTFFRMILASSRDLPS